MALADYDEAIESLFQLIEDQVDELEADVDCEVNAGVMTLTCPNGSVLIFSRQSAVEQLWLAAKLGGFHFEQKEGAWICTRSGRTVQSLLEECSQDQIGEAIILPI